ncbi:MAG: NAD(P)H-binding protein [Gammaproteobacteria bacterium]|nr:NAD(P)H-binding protein [Gammaproteobacteria bacterium]MDH3767711.1 NAD(P)H-binding protein [Gammaproteobacteria bacterium]
MNERTVLVVGATGLVGSHLLNLLLQHTVYGAVRTLGRRAPGLKHDRLTHHLFPTEQTHGAVPAADVLFCCLGTTIKRAGSQGAFKAIDLDLVVSVARGAAAQGTETLLVVSSVGADSDSGNFYLRTKGEMEKAVAELGFKRVGILRPSLLLGAREEFRPAEKLGTLAAQLINPFLVGGLAKYRGVDAKTVAAAMIGLDQSVFAGCRILEGQEIAQLTSR